MITIANNKHARTHTPHAHIHTVSQSVFINEDIYRINKLNNYRQGAIQVLRC